MKKKTLYASSALCAVALLQSHGAQAEGIELGLGGYANTLFSVGGLNPTAGRDRFSDSSGALSTPDSAPDLNATGLWADGEVWFLGEYKHDNGITFGAKVELEVYSAVTTDDTISQHYLFVEGDFGRIEAGSQDLAAYQMHYAAPVVGLPINSGWVTVFIPSNPDSLVVFETPGTSTYLDYGSGENQLTYYTPRIYGFQLGVSYAPSISFSGDGQNFPTEADRNTQYYNGFSVGANYVDELGPVGVAVSVGYTRSEAPDSVTSLGAPDSYQAFSVGTTLSYAGFTIGGAYANSFDGQVFDTYSDDGTYQGLVSTEGQSWNIGAAYSVGNWTFGGEYFQGDAEGFVPGTQGPGIVGAGNNDKLYAATGGLTYELGPGITARGGVMYGRWSAESGAVNTGVIGAAGLTFNF